MIYHNLLDVDAIKRALKTRVLGQAIVYLQSVGSTNDIAKELADAGEAEGAIVLADYQSAGRGRMARSWVAPAGTSILMSLLLKPALSPDRVMRLTMAASLGVCAAIRSETQLDAQIKWPNDILVNGKKCAGILAEVGIESERVAYVVVGLGVNVNFCAGSVVGVPPSATTIADELGREFPREQLIVAFVREIEAYYVHLQAGEDLRAKWKTHLTTLGQRVRAAEADRVVEGIAEDVDEDGALVLKRADGTRERLIAEDVTLI